MSQSIDRLPFPSAVLRGPQAISGLGLLCGTIGKRPLILGGRKALGATEKAIVQSLDRAGIAPAAIEWYGGECMMGNIDRLEESASARGADCIIAVGGGKALDTGKGAASKTGLPVITVPTIAATCAAATPLSIIYSEAGEFADNLFEEHCPVGIVVDTSVIAAAPLVWLEAGMGDTLAKMYELRAASAGMEMTSHGISAIGNGRICYDIVGRFGPRARDEAKRGLIGAAFDATVDAIILSAGICSIFGGEGLRNSGAHGIYNGFTKIPATREVAHGLVVGYGNLCLLAIEGRSDEEIAREMKLAVDCGIPTSLARIAEMSERELRIAAEAAAVSVPMSCMPFPVTPEMVLAAIKRVDALAG